MASSTDYSVINSTGIYAKYYPSKKTKCMAFDLDGTLIDTKSGNKFPVSEDDWKFKFPNIIQVLTNYNDNGFEIVLFTNQKPLGKSKTKLIKFVSKVESIIKLLDFHISYFIATNSSKYRKPMTGMCDLMTELMFKDGFVVADSVYCGDAAGRTSMWQYSKKGTKKTQYKVSSDFSFSDMYFALNCGIQFVLPEYIFNGLERIITPISPPSRFYLEYSEHFNRGSMVMKNLEHIMHQIDTPIMILMIGIPASGKTRFVSRIAANTEIGSFEIASKDNIKVLKKYKIQLSKQIKSRSNIIVDNTNTKYSDRCEHISAAKKEGYTIIGIVMDTHDKLIDHLNMYRTNFGNRKFIPRIVFNTMKKQMRECPVISTEFDFCLTVKNQLDPDDFDAADVEKIKNYYVC